MLPFFAVVRSVQEESGVWSNQRWGTRIMGVKTPAHRTHIQIGRTGLECKHLLVSSGLLGGALWMRGRIRGTHKAAHM